LRAGCEPARLEQLDRHAEREVALDLAALRPEHLHPGLPGHVTGDRQQA
jgi:hypothetical protein